MPGPPRRLALLNWMALPTAVAWLSACSIAAAQIVTPPKPIAAPPIPAPPRLGPTPRVALGMSAHPPRPVLAMPEPPDLAPIPIPPAAPMTPVDPADTTPPPASGATTGPPLTVSPGASDSKIEKIGLSFAPGAETIAAAADVTLRGVAKSLSRNPDARVEVRVFSPSKPGASQSNARRLSLSRYLAIRALLAREGIADNRIDGRPLVSEPNELNPDRVELYIEH